MDQDIETVEKFHCRATVNDLVAYSLIPNYRYLPASVSDVARYRPGKRLRGLFKKLCPYGKMSEEQRAEEYTARNELLPEPPSESEVIFELPGEPSSDSEDDLPQCSAPLVLG